MAAHVVAVASPPALPTASPCQAGRFTGSVAFCSFDYTAGSSWGAAPLSPSPSSSPSVFTAAPPWIRAPTPPRASPNAPSTSDARLPVRLVLAVAAAVDSCFTPVAATAAAKRRGRCLLLQPTPPQAPQPPQPNGPALAAADPSSAAPAPPLAAATQSHAGQPGPVPCCLTLASLWPPPTPAPAVAQPRAGRADTPLTPSAPLGRELACACCRLPPSAHTGRTRSLMRCFCLRPLPPAARCSLPAASSAALLQ
nr:predicted GPI-anchored protein 58 [Aegilops tauschii subsp. strangulata]